MCVTIENIAPDAAKRCLQRLFSVPSSINFIKSRRLRSSGSLEVAESFFVKSLLHRPDGSRFVQQRVYGMLRKHLVFIVGECGQVRIQSICKFANRVIGPC